jgi:hypothetical protein
MSRPNPRIDEWRPSGEFKVRGNAQPIFKLHGSANWRDRSGNNLLVMGANKNISMREKDVLNWYLDNFKYYLSAPNTRLMVIGYSFMDDHINNEIITAQTKGLTTFLVDPAGRDALSDKRLTGAVIRPWREIEHIKLLGISTRGLTGSFGDDALEHGKFEGFFASTGG